MRKALLPVLVLALTFGMSGCGFDTDIDSSVTIIKATPTPEPTPTPEVTPTPEPTPTPEAATEQSPSGVIIQVQEGTYYASAPLNLRSDCSAEAELLASVSEGTELKSTGVCENGWIRVDYNGQICYASGDYVTQAAPAAE